jgi:uncharacterized membrane protein YheB (UPF0754 family)
MLFLKSLLFIVWNIALGTLLIYSIKWFLFNPKQRKIFGMRNPLTPGFLVRKREWLFTKARDMLQDYLRQATDRSIKNGYLNKWEEQVWQAAWSKTEFVDGWALLPGGVKKKIHDTMANVVRDLASKVLRKTVPHFIEQWQVENRIDEFDEKFGIEFFYKYFRQYVYKPLMIAVAAINLLIGILNMILFLIIA